MASRLIESSPEDGKLSENSISTQPEFELPDASFLLYGTLEQEGFDLVITNPEGDVVVVHDYFSFSPPPNLVIANGAGLSPEMVRSLMPQAFGDDIAFAGPATSGATAEKIGTVTLLFGDVRVKHADGSEEKLSRGDTLYKGDVIITGARAFVKAKMLDGTRFHLGKNGEAALEDFQFDAAAKIGTFVATVRVGGFHYKSGKIGKLRPNSTDSHSTIKTPSAIIGIRGSELDGSVDVNGLTIIVHKSGYLVIADINGENIVVLEIPGNTSVIVLDGSPAFFVQPTQQQIQALGDSLPPVDTPEEIAEQEAEDQAAGDDQGEDGEAGEGEAGTEEGDDDPDGTSGEEDDSDDQDDSDDEDSADDEDETGDDENKDDVSDDDEGDSADGESDDPVEGDQRAADLDPSQPGDGVDGTAPGEDGASPNDGDPTVAEERETSDPNDLDADLRYYDEPLDEVGANTRGESGTGDEPDLETLNNPDTTLDEQPAIEEEAEEEVADQEELPPDNEPEAADDVIIAATSDPVDIGELILANDVDRDENQTPVLSSVTALDGTGTLELDPETNRLTYTPDEDAFLRLDSGETLQETFSYTVVSGDLTDTASVTILLVGANDDPVPEEDIVATREDNILKIEVLENDEDPDPEDTLTISEVETEGILGFVRIEEDGEFLNYFPPQNLAQGDVITETFSYTVSDGDATSTAVVTVTVTGVNNPPVISVDSPVAIPSNSGLTEILLSDIFADSDLGSNLTIVEIDQSQTKGTIIIGSIFYDPGNAFDFLKEGETGTDSFFIRVVDEFDATGAGTYTFSVPGVNDGPIAENDSYDLIENGRLTIDSVAGVLSNDTDPEGETLTLEPVLLDVPSNGSLILNEDGSFTYIPNPGFSGTDGFGYLVSDPQGLVARGAVTLNILPATVVPIDPPPVVEPPIVEPPVVNNLPTGTVNIDNLAPGEGDILTATNTLVDADGLGTITYTWEIASEVGWIFLSSGPTLSVISTMIGIPLRVTASYIDLAGNSESVSSGQTAPVAGIVNAPFVEFAAPGPFVTIVDDYFETQTDFEEFDNNPLDPLIYSVMGLPVGVTASTDTVTKVVTISGVPSVPGSYNIIVTATDFDGTATDSYALAVVAPPPSSVFDGPGTYTFVNGVEDYVLGVDAVTETLHTITFSGTAEPGDTFVQADGQFFLQLDNLGNDLTVVNDPIVVGGSGVDQITLQGMVTNPSNIFGGLQGGDTIINETYLGLQGASTSASIINNQFLDVFDFTTLFNGPFTQSSLGETIISGNSSSGGLSVSGNLDNDGKIILHSNGFDANLSVSPGSAFNSPGEIFSIGFGAPNTIAANLSLAPGGSLFVAHDLTFNNALYNLDFAGGTVDVAFGSTLEIQGGSVVLGNDTTFFGGGTIRITGASPTIFISGGLDFNDFGQQFDFDAPGLTFSNVSATPELFSISPGAMLTLDSGIINTDLANFGHLVFMNSGNQVNSQLFSNEPGGVLEINSFGGVADLTIASTTTNTFTNRGTLLIDNFDIGGAATSLNVSGTLNNVNEIIVRHSGDPSFSGNHVLSAKFHNNGDLRLDANLELVGSLDQINNGTIYLGAGDLKITGANSFTSVGTITGDGVIDNFGMLAPFSLIGVVRPEFDATITSTATISFSGDLYVGPSAVFDLDVANMLNFDSVNVTGTLDFDPSFAVTGSYQLNFLPGHGVTAGTLPGVITSSVGGITGAVGAPVSHNLGAAYTLTASTGGSGTDTVDITVTASFDQTFTNGQANGNFHDPLNWSPGPVPGPTDNVLISSAGSLVVGFTTTGTQTIAIGSLSMEGIGPIFLVLSVGDELILNGSSMIQQNSKLSVTNGAILTIDGAVPGANVLTVNGNIDWLDGDLTDGNGFDAPTSRLVNNGTIDATVPEFVGLPPASLVLDVIFENHGNLNIDNVNSVNPGILETTSPSTPGAVPGTTGSGFIDNYGFIFVSTEPTIAVDIYNHDGAFIDIESTSSTTVATVAVFDGNITNDGTIIVDNTSSVSTTMTTTAQFTGNVINNGFINVGNHSSSTPGTLFDIADGMLTNNGSFTFDNFGGGGVLTLWVNTLLNNFGNIDAFSSATIQGAGANGSFTLDSSGGRINVDNLQTLTLSNDVILQIDEFSRIDGAGTLAFTGSPNLQLLGDASIGIFDFNFGTTGSQVSNIIGSGTLFVEPGAGLTFDSKDRIQSGVFLVNEGTTSLLGDGISLLGGTENGLNGTLFIDNFDAVGIDPTTFDGPFTNNGIIFFNQGVGPTHQLNVSNGGGPGTLENFGSFHVTQTSADTQANRFNGIFDNQGNLVLEYSLRLDYLAGPVVHTNNGVIELRFGERLILGGNNSLSVLPDGQIIGEGTIDVSAAGVQFDMAGSFLPGGVESARTLTVLGDAQFYQSSEVMIELDDVGTNDLLAFDSGTASLKGRLVVERIFGFTPVAGNVFTIVTASALLLGSFDSVDGLDFDPSGSVLLDYDQSTNQIDLTTVNVDFIGAPGINADLLVGTPATGEFFHGGDGDDVLSNIGTLDTAYGGPGNDEFFPSPGFKRLDGGDGFDAVEYLQSVDYRTVEGHVFERIEAISIEDGTPQLLEFDAAAISRIVDGDQQFAAVNNALAIVGDSEDKVVLHGDFLENGERSLNIFGVTQLYVVFTEGEVSLLANEFMELEIWRTDGSVGRYGNSHGELLTGTGFNDILVGRLGDDTLDGQGGADELVGGPGNDALRFDPADVSADGGEGVDSLLISGSINLSGLPNLVDFSNFERLDMTNGTVDTLQLDMIDVLTMVGDNSLDALLPDANTKMIIEGDASDSVILDGVNISNMVSALPANVTSDYVEVDIFNTGELYVKFVDLANSIDLYVHANLVDDTPLII